MLDVVEKVQTPRPVFTSMVVDLEGMKKGKVVEVDDMESSEVETLSSKGSTVMVCPICGGTPCDWDEWGSEVTEAAEMMENMKKKMNVENDDDDEEEEEVEENVPSRLRRKALYKAFIYAKYGHLGGGKRMFIPDCVKDEIYDMYPDPKVVAVETEDC